MRILRELKDLFRLVVFTPRHEKAITFYSEGQSYLGYFEGLLHELTRAEGVTICYLSSDPDEVAMVAKNERVIAFFLDRLLPFYMVLCRCRVFVMTLLDLDQFHLRRSIFDVHYVCVFHGLYSTHMLCRAGSYDHYDSLLCPGPQQMREIRRREEIEGLPPKELVEGGYPRLDAIRRAFRLRGEPADVSERVVLVAPSWHSGNILDVCGEELVGTLLSSGFSVVLRIHPETVKRKPAQVESFASRFADDTRVVIERSVRDYDSLLRADVLITDWSSIALEYAFGTERPVIHIDAARKVHNESYERLGIEPMEISLRADIGAIVPVDDVNRIGAHVERMIRERESWRVRIVGLRSEHVFALDESVAVGARHILRRAGMASRA